MARRDDAGSWLCWLLMMNLRWMSRSPCYGPNGTVPSPFNWRLRCHASALGLEPAGLLRRSTLPGPSERDRTDDPGKASTGCPARERATQLPPRTAIQSKYVILLSYLHSYTAAKLSNQPLHLGPTSYSSSSLYFIPFFVYCFIWICTYLYLPWLCVRREKRPSRRHLRGQIRPIHEPSGHDRREPP